MYNLITQTYTFYTPQGKLKIENKIFKKNRLPRTNPNFPFTSSTDYLRKLCKR